MARGVVLVLVPARLVVETVDFAEGARTLCGVVAGFRVDTGVALLFTFALGRRGGLVRDDWAERDLTGEGGLEIFPRDGGREDVSLYVSFTVTCNEMNRY